MKLYIKSSSEDTIVSTNEITLAPTEIVNFLKHINELKNSKITIVDEKAGHFKIRINEVIYSLYTLDAREYIS